MLIDKVGKTLAMWVLIACVLGVVAACAESRARIVRLSEVEGSVQMDRANGDGFDKTFLNMPVVEGSRLKTGDNGRVEVEFEDGSALRIVSNSEVEFTRLALGDDGRKLSTVQLASGMAYVNYRGKNGDEFTLNFGRQSVSLSGPAHFRIGVGADEATLAVLKGQVSGNGQSGPFEVDQKHTATFDLSGDHSEIAKNYEENPNDAWDLQQSEYQNRYAGSGKSSSPYAYGTSDLNYYGSYMSVPGYGTVWQPYFMDASWSPFQDGGFVYYAGAGYMWVSAYPWGWMPYRYGNWVFVPGFGWAWQPGYFNSWYPVPRVVNPPQRTVVPAPPVRGHATVLVGKGLTVNPPAGVAQGRLTIAPGSAGLGVPRGTVRDLNRISHDIGKNSRPVEVTAEAQGRIAPPSHSSGANSASGRNPSFPTASPTPAMVPAPLPPRMSAPARSSKPH